MKKEQLLVPYYPVHVIDTISRVVYALGRISTPEEILLSYMIKERNADGNYYTADGARQRATKSIGITNSQYKTAFNNLVKHKCIIKKKDGKKGNRAYFRFHSAINFILKENKQ